MLLGYHFLSFFNNFIVEFQYFAGFNTDQVVMMLTITIRLPGTTTIQATSFSNRKRRNSASFPKARSDRLSTITNDFCAREKVKGLTGLKLFLNCTVSDVRTALIKLGSERKLSSGNSKRVL